jgi:hypothetical protein
MTKNDEKGKAPSAERGQSESPTSPESHDPSEAQEINPFDPENLRLDQSALGIGAAKKLLTTVPIRKPHKQDWIRVNPDPAYQIPVALLEFERDTYVVTPAVAAQLLPTEYDLAILFLRINRQKVVSLWPVKIAAADGKAMAWHTSAKEAAELAMKRWVNVKANMDLGAYEISEAVANYGEPEWPELTFGELLKIAFKSQIIADTSHPVIQKLRGLA